MQTESPQPEIAHRAPAPTAILYAAVGFGLLALMLMLVSLRGRSRTADFNIYYATAAAVDAGLDPYSIDLPQYMRGSGMSRMRNNWFVHPTDAPTFTLLTAPMGWVSAPVAYAAWFMMNMACLAGSLWLLFGPSSQLDRRTAVFLSVCSLAFSPLIINIHFAQSQIIVLLGIVAMYRLLESGHDVPAGLVLATIGLLRFYPLVLGGHLLVQRRGRAIAALAIGFIAGTAITVAMLGIKTTESFLHVIGFVGNAPWLSVPPIEEVRTFNLSLSAFVTRLLMPIFGGITEGALSLRKPIILVADLAILVMTFRASLRSTPERSLSLWVATMLLLTPVVWVYYLTLLVVSFGMIAIAAVHLKTSATVWQLAMHDYCGLVILTPLLDVLTFRRSMIGWGRGLLGELGFLLLLLAWIVARRFALESQSSSHT